MPHWNVWTGDGVRPLAETAATTSVAVTLSSITAPPPPPGDGEYDGETGLYICLHGPWGVLSSCIETIFNGVTKLAAARTAGQETAAPGGLIHLRLRLAVAEAWWREGLGLGSIFDFG